MLHCLFQVALGLAGASQAEGGPLAEYGVVGAGFEDLEVMVHRLAEFLICDGLVSEEGIAAEGQMEISGHVAGPEGDVGIGEVVDDGLEIGGAGTCLGPGEIPDCVVKGVPGRAPFAERLPGPPGISDRDHRRQEHGPQDGILVGLDPLDPLGQPIGQLVFFQFVSPLAFHVP